MAILDPLRKAFGLPTPVEAGEARREKARMEASTDPRDVFATSVAEAMAPMSRDEARRAFHELNDVALSPDADLRWTTTAARAREFAEDSASRSVRSLDGALSRAVGERALMEAARNIDGIARHGFEPAERVETILERKRDMVADGTRAVMSTGLHAEMNARTQANDVIHGGDRKETNALHRDVGDVVGIPGPGVDDGREWIQKATRARLAAAQVGALTATRTVEIAMDATVRGHMVEGSIAQTPDRVRNERLEGPERAKLIGDRIERNRIESLPGRDPVLGTDKHLARHGIVATGIGAPVWRGHGSAGRSDVGMA